jgi:hypothetical protein
MGSAGFRGQRSAGTVVDGDDVLVVTMDGGTVGGVVDDVVVEPDVGGDVVEVDDGADVVVGATVVDGTVVVAATVVVVIGDVVLVGGAVDAVVVDVDGGTSVVVVVPDGPPLNKTMALMSWSYGPNVTLPSGHTPSQM